MRLQKFKLDFEITFAENHKPFLDEIASFLHRFGIKTSYSFGAGAWVLLIFELDSVVIAARKMIPFSHKKSVELRSMLAYLTGSATGDETLKVFNEQVLIGKRRGKVRESSMPYTRVEGLLLGARAKVITLRRLARQRRISVPRNVKRKMRTDRAHDLSQEKIAKKYGYSREIVRKVLGLL